MNDSSIDHTLVKNIQTSGSYNYKGVQAYKSLR